MKRLLILAAAVGALGTCGQNAGAGTLRIVNSVSSPLSDERGMDLAYDGEHLWALSWRANTVDDEIYVSDYSTFIRELNPSTGNALRRIGLDWDLPRGLLALASDGVNLWSARSLVASGPVKHLDPGTPSDELSDFIEKRSVTEPGSVLSTLELPLSPDTVTTGLTWDGDHLWLADTKHRQIMQVDPSDMAIVRSFPAPGNESRGLAWGDLASDGNSLWYLHSEEKLIYQMNPGGTVIGTWTAPGDDPWGLAFDGEYFWIGEDTGEIFQLAVPEPSALMLLLGAMAALSFFWVGRRLKNPFAGRAHRIPTSTNRIRS